MMKRLTQLKSKKGTTLAEVLVAMFITSILLGIAFGMMSTETRLMATIKGNAHLDAVCDTVNEYVRSSVGTAKRGAVYKYEPATVSNIATAAQNYVDSQTTQNDKLYALMIRYPDPTQPHTTDNPQMARIYDFGPLDSSNLSGFTTKLGAIMSTDDASGLFYDGYYENASFEMTVVTSGANIKIYSQFRNPYTGDLANQPRTLSFSMMNGGSITGGAFSDGDSMGDGIVILYTKNDPSIYVTTPTSTP
ncbi:MAG: prepilin-type N-terminal cleavage/methylation domain-containing protein [Firmicutes bacterium]|nr:prepilin-type N-terminal cleavage/methylation domain-containing protein [[Eubacterium] siraeum]MCM1487943.1 prepilin-type N-terminal cleavage/methylation domain-containing protein [Bacillota bacterium]